MFDAGAEKREKKAVMHLKKWFLGLCLILLVIGELLLFSANRQKDAALVQMREAKQQAAQLQTELDQSKSADAGTQNAENNRLRAENQSLSHKLSLLQAENDQLRSTNHQLIQWLGELHATSQQQSEQLQQLQTENQRAADAAQAQQQLVEQAEVAQRNACINNLRQIDAAKQEWALEKNKTADAVPAEQDLLPYFKDGIFPVCPSGGTYTIGAVNEPPTCSIPGHALP